MDDCPNCERERQRLQQSTDWYQQRFNRLRRWVKEEVEPLSAEVAHRYFSICANGSPAPHESADWTNTMHGLAVRAEVSERRLSEATETADELRLKVLELQTEVERLHRKESAAELRNRLWPESAAGEKRNFEEVALDDANVRFMREQGDDE